MWEYVMEDCEQSRDRGWEVRLRKSNRRSVREVGGGGGDAQG